MKTVEKGWGYELWITNNSEYCGKLLFFNKNKKCSWHYHVKKDEVFYIHSGKILLKYLEYEDDIAKAKEIVLEPGDSFHVSRRMRHQMYALEDTELFEFSTHHDDRDSYRVIKGD